MHSLTCVYALAALFAAESASAQIYQCLDAGGKKIFSQTPCAAQGGSGEKMISAAPAPLPAAPVQGKPGMLYGNGGAATPPKDWAAENAAANARASAQSTNASSQNYPQPGLRKGAPASPPKGNGQIVAECEAGHGARCGSSGEIAQRRMEQRTLTPAEQRQQQDAVAARRQRAMDEAFNRR